MNLSKSPSSISCLHFHRKKYLLKAIEYFIHTVYTTVFGIITLTYLNNWIAVLFFILAGSALVVFCFKLVFAFQPILNHIGIMADTFVNKNRQLIKLFDEIDRDIATQGKRIGSTWIGKEWLFYDRAVPIRDIRGIFLARNRNWLTRRLSYVILLLNSNKCYNICLASSATDQKELYDHLVKRIPLAVTGSGFIEFTQSCMAEKPEWDSLNKKFADNVALQMTAEGEDIKVGGAVEFFFKAADGVTTSQVTVPMMTEAVECLQKEESVMLSLGLPSHTKLGKFIGLKCQRRGVEECFAARLLFEKKEFESDLGIAVSLQEMQALFAELFTNHRVSNLSGWKIMQMEEQDFLMNIILSVDDDSFTYFTFEDVAIALDGLNEGTCQNIKLSVLGRLKSYMTVTGKEDDYTVELCDFGRVYSYYYRRHTIYRGYVTNWLGGYFRTHELPELVPEWVDVSKEMREQKQKETSN